MSPKDYAKRLEIQIAELEAALEKLEVALERIAHSPHVPVTIESIDIAKQALKGRNPMNHIRTRNELMAWLEANAPRPGIARAMQNGKTELLGVFRRIPPQCDMGWIVEVQSLHGTIWHIAIKPDKRTHGYWCHVVSRVPWEHWMGDTGFGINKDTPLHVGDNPEIYEEMKFYETKK